MLHGFVASSVLATSGSAQPVISRSTEPAPSVVGKLGAIRRSSGSGALSPMPDASGYTLRLTPPPGAVFAAKSMRGTSGTPIADSASNVERMGGSGVARIRPRAG
ncbi:hypothetical protein [Burkholderia ubonensis]|uniref:hypothetical protein n=1 Tax=Burkholderia ubonensis TaxID=101571 RepID=UPI0007580328|nr:hypothetical protein [Burkholderia ubonensis]KVT31714.1 hypothetical protein WK51_26375 [Burkholderia ubonensis]